VNEAWNTWRFPEHPMDWVGLITLACWLSIAVGACT